MLPDIPGHVTTSKLMCKNILVASGTQTAAGVDVKDFIGELAVIIATESQAADGSTTGVFTLQDSADNTTFATFAGAPTPVTVTAASAQSTVTLDQRNCRKYVQAKAVVTGTTATFATYIGLVGVKQVYGGSGVVTS